MRLSFLSPQSLAGSSARHPWRTLAAWVLLLVAITFLGNTFSGPTTGEGAGFTNDPDSQVGTDLIDEHFHHTTYATETIVLHSERYTVDDAAFKQVADNIVASLDPWKGDIKTLTNYYDLADWLRQVGRV